MLYSLLLQRVHGTWAFSVLCEVIFILLLNLMLQLRGYFTPPPDALFILLL